MHGNGEEFKLKISANMQSNKSTNIISHGTYCMHTRVTISPHTNISDLPIGMQGKWRLFVNIFRVHAVTFSIAEKKDDYITSTQMCGSNK